MDLWVSVGVFVVSLAVLIKSSDYFTDSAEEIGIFLGIPSFIVGVTIVSVGTSLPELASSVVAATKGSTEIVVGNVVGSNISNIFLVLGVAAIIGKHLKTSWELIHVDLPILIASSFILIVSMLDGVITTFEAFLCLLGYPIYIGYTVSMQRKHKSEEATRKALGRSPPLILLVSSVFIYLSAKYTVESVIHISEMLSIGAEVIAMVAIALGTSLPELMVSSVAAKKGNSELAIGNVLGSNIFNSFVVIGIPGLFGSLVVPDIILSFAMPMMVISTLMYFFTVQDREITQWEGMMLVLLYLFFIHGIFTYGS